MYYYFESVWNPSFALCGLCIATAHDVFVVSARKWTRANELVRLQNVRDFPQTKSDSEIKACFLLNEHGDPRFLFYKFNESNILNNWEKKLAEIYGYFFGKWNKCYR